MCQYAKESNDLSTRHLTVKLFTQTLLNFIIKVLLPKAMHFDPMQMLLEPLNIIPEVRI